MNEAGVNCLNYLDDFIIWDSNKEKCLEGVQLLGKTRSHLGFIINSEKSILSPTQQPT